jgi:tetratricopeptide (TPR) repeat protein
LTWVSTEDEIRGHSLLAHMYLLQGDVEAAAARLAEAEQLAEETNASMQFPSIQRLLAQLHLARRQVKVAWDWAKRALAQAREAKLPDEEGLSLYVLGQTLLANNQTEAALTAFERSLALLAGRYPYETACAQTEWGGHLILIEDEAGRPLLQEARAIFARLGAQQNLIRVDELLEA